MFASPGSYGARRDALPGLGGRVDSGARVAGAATRIRQFHLLDLNWMIG